MGELTVKIIDKKSLTARFIYGLITIYRPLFV